MNKKKPIRVLHVLGKLDTGGAERIVIDIYRNIDKENIQFDFVTHSNENSIFDEELKKMGANIYKMPKFRIKNLAKYISLWVKLIKNEKIDIIHGHQTTTGFIYFLIAKLNNVPVLISHSHSSGHDSKLKWILTRFGNSIPKYKLAVSDLAAINEYGKNYKSKNIQILKNGINSELFKFNLEIRNEYRNMLDIKDNFVLGHVGRFKHVKNHSFLIEVFKEIKRMENKAKLILVGDGEERNKIEKQVLEMDLQDSVIFLGMRDDVPLLLNSFDVFVLPSFYEGFPGVIIEAQANDLPCFISNNITKEVNISEKVNYLDLKQSSKQWALEILNYKYNQRTINNLIVEKGYDVKSITKVYEHFYLKAISNV